jgi:type II secretory pathway pseudopilin PulG
MLKRARGEDGFTLVEVSVSMIVSLAILGMLATIIVVYSKAEASTVNSANAAANVRIALLQLQHDIQSANPLSTLSTLSAYNDELQLTIQPSNSVVTWQYTFAGNANKLTRQVGSAQAVTVLTGVNNGDPSSGGLVVFTYFDHCGINQVTQPQATPASVSASTTVVGISLSVIGLHTAPYGTTTDVAIMNQPPAASRCG